MQVILIQDVPSLGKKGEVKNVAKGFVRNFLIPQKKAVVATSKRLAEYEKLIAKRRNEMEMEKKQHQELMRAISGITVKVLQKASTQNHLFGSLDKDFIAKVLASEKQINLEPSMIKLEQPIKKIGNYEIMVQFSPEMKTSFNFAVQAIQEKKAVKSKTSAKTSKGKSAKKKAEDKK